MIHRLCKTGKNSSVKGWRKRHSTQPVKTQIHCQKTPKKAITLLFVTWKVSPACYGTKQKKQLMQVFENSSSSSCIGQLFICVLLRSLIKSQSYQRNRLAKPIQLPAQTYSQIFIPMEILDIVCLSIAFSFPGHMENNYKTWTLLLLILLENKKL